MVFEELNYRSIAIYGLGLEGKSTLNFLKRHNYQGLIYLVDDQVKDLDALLTDNVLLGDKEVFAQVDLIIKSPGIIVSEDFLYFNKLSSQTEICLKYYSQQVIGITGTKGKSTTTSLIYHLFKIADKEVFIAGNIGKPVFDIIDDITDNSIVVYEMSCHQLALSRLSPKIAIFLNCYEEHLDRYHNFENYLKAKENIYRFQNNGLVYINSKLRNINDHTNYIYLGRDVLCKDKTISYKNHHLDLSSYQYSLIGEHNFFDIGVAYALAKDFNIADEIFIRAVCTFKTLPHRLENLGTYHGITFYNDSISTSVESSIAAMQSLNHIDVVLLGGLDRGIDYHALLENLKVNPIPKIIFMYASGLRMLKELGQCHKEIYYCDHLKQAVIKAYEIAKKGTVVLMSPASASYDSFKNFEERGNKYFEYIKKYQGGQQE